MHRSHLILFTLLLSSFAQAEIYKAGNQCYEVRLTGNMVDTLACKTTAVNYRKIGCDGKNGKKFEKSLAKLDSCDSKSARGTLKTPDGDIRWVAFNNSNAGFDIWKLKSSGAIAAENAAKAAAAQPKPVRVKTPTQVVESTGDRESDFIKVLSESDWSFTSSWVAGLFQYYPNQFRDSSIYQSQIGFSLLQLDMSLQPREDVSAEFEVSAGPYLPIWLSSPWGITATQTVDMTKAELVYLPPVQDLSLDFGLMHSPLLLDAEDSPLDFSFISKSIAEFFMRPHIFSGFMAEKKWSPGIGTNLFVVNGWNEVFNINQKLAFGATVDSPLGNSPFFARLGYYNGREGVPATVVNVQVFQGSLAWKNLAEVQFDIGSVDDGRKFSSYLAQGYYPFDEKRKLGARIEWSDNSNSFLRPNTQWVDVLSLSASYKQEFNSIFSGQLEFGYDDPLTILAGGTNNQSQYIMLVGFNLNL